MNFIILGNLFSLLGSVLLIVSILSKNKKEMIKLQIFNCIPAIIACIFLNGISGIIVNFIALIRNTLIYFDKMNKYIMTFLVIALIFIGLYFNKSGIVGILPIIASTEYCIIISIKNVTFKTVKIALLINLVLWSIYNIYIIDISSIVLNIFMIITNIVAIFKNKES